MPATSSPFAALEPASVVEELIKLFICLLRFVAEKHKSPQIQQKR